MKALIENDLYCEYDNRGNITAISDDLQNLLGNSKTLLGTNDVLSFAKKYNFRTLWKEIKKDIEVNHYWSGLLEYNLATNKTVFLQTSILPIYSNENNLLKYVSYKHDVTSNFNPESFERACVLPRIKSEINTQSELNNLIIKSDKRNDKVFVVYIKIKNFSSVVKFYERATIDELIDRVINKLKEAKGCDFYTLDDGRFLLICRRGISLSQADSLIAKLSSILKECSIMLTPYNLEIHSGLAHCQPKKITKKVRIAQREAVNKNLLFCLYSKGLKNRIIQEKEVVNDIVLAIKSEQILMYLQPIVDVKTQDIYKYEALARLKVGGKLVRPDRFLSLAREMNVYHLITKAIFFKAVTFLDKNQDASISMNLSTQDITEEATCGYIKKCLKEHHDTIKDRLTFEIVETNNIDDYKGFNAFSSLVKKYGVKISIDDFGSGFSNFSHLSNINFDFLKIDGEIIKQLKNKKNKAFVKLLSSFCRKNGIKSIAEYVEDEKTYKKLKKLKIDYIQGYYLGKPRDSEPL